MMTSVSRPHDRRRFELELAGCRWHRADNPFAGALRNHVCGGSVLHEHEKGSQRVKSLKGKHPMYTRKQTLILVAAFGAALVAAPVLRQRLSQFPGFDAQGRNDWGEAK
jgi:hypothetical protein